MCQEKIKFISSWHTGSNGRVGATRSRRFSVEKLFLGGIIHVPQGHRRGPAGPHHRHAYRAAVHPAQGVCSPADRPRGSASTAPGRQARIPEVRPLRPGLHFGAEFVGSPALPHPRFFLCFKERNEGLKNNYDHSHPKLFLFLLYPPCAGACLCTNEVKSFTHSPGHFAGAFLYKQFSPPIRGRWRGSLKSPAEGF